MGSRRRGLGQVDIDRISNELSSTKNGAFTKALVEGLEGKADIIPDGKITISELEAYLADTVKIFTNGQQTPTTAKTQTIADFPVVVY